MFNRLRTVLFLGGALALGGCSTFATPGAPDRSFDIDDDIRQLEQHFSTAASIEGYYASAQTKADRDKFVTGRLVLVDIHYIQFIKQFAINKALIDSAVDIATVGVDLATTLVGGAPTKAILGAVSGGLTSSKISIDKNFFQEKTVPVLVGEMNAQRVAARIPIIRGLREELDVYSFELSVIDLQAYYEAGTFIGALQSIQKSSGVKQAEAEAELRIVLDDIYGVDPNSTKLREFWKPGGIVNNANRTRIDDCMASVGLATGPGTLAGLITGKSQAEDRRRVVACLGL